MSDPVIKKDKVYQKFNLKELFGVDVKDLPELKEAFGQKALDVMLRRTADGVGVNGRAFKGYSKSYTESNEFKAAGKSARDVNLSLHGDMLGTLDVIETKGNTVKLGWEDELQNAKAYNHNIGDTLPKRPFFGLNKGELQAIVRELKSDFRDAAKELRTNGRDSAVEKSMELLEKVKGTSIRSEDGED